MVTEAAKRHAALLRAEAIVVALAKVEEPIKWEYSQCLACYADVEAGVRTNEFGGHLPTCPWWLARQYVEAEGMVNAYSMDDRRDAAMRASCEGTGRLAPMVDRAGDFVIRHGERGDLDPENPDACLCGEPFYLWCPEWPDWPLHFGRHPRAWTATER